MGSQPPTTPARRIETIAVLGGGLAGMTAAYRLASQGYRVTLVERRPYLGGRAYSFVDRETGAQIDNGQHVFLGCCTAYIDLLRDLGSLGRTWRQDRLRVEVRSPNGKRGVLSGLPLPAPLHLAASFARYPHLSLRERLHAIPAMVRIQREHDRNRPELRAISFGDWLRLNGQSPRAIANLWDLIVLPSLNDNCDDVSASAGFMVFQAALLRNAHGADVGYARSSLSDIMGEPMAAKLRELRGTLMLGRSVERLAVDNGCVTGVTLGGGETLLADHYLSALPPHVLLDLLPKDVRRSPAFVSAANHTWSPIVNLHIWYDRHVADFDFVAFVDSPVQWLFNRTRIANLPGPGDYLTVSLSGAWEWWPKTKDQLRRTFGPELARLLPAAQHATVDRFVVVKEQRATFRSLPAAPTSPENRLPQTSPIPNLFLAGDWTDTGWPSTMESAVRSGNAAAEAIVHDLARDSRSAGR